jgi:hypothetical protein
MGAEAAMTLSLHSFEAGDWENRVAAPRAQIRPLREKQRIHLADETKAYPHKPRLSFRIPFFFHNSILREIRPWISGWKGPAPFKKYFSKQGLTFEKLSVLYRQVCNTN